MPKLPLNLSHFKKVSSDDKTTILQHQAGHQITLAHKSLSPKIREQLNSLPLHKAAGGPIFASSANMASALKESYKKPKRMAEGGDVQDDKSSSNAIDPSDMDPQSAIAAQGLQQGVQQVSQIPTVQKALDFGGNLDQYQAMLQAAMQGNPQAQQALAQHSAGVAMGTIKSVPTEAFVPAQATPMPGIIGKTVQIVGGIDPRTVARSEKLSAARDFLDKVQGALNRKAPGVNQDMLRAAESHYQTIKATLPPSPAKMAEGGSVESEGDEESANSSPQPSARAPVTININSGGSQQPPATLANPSPGSQFAESHPPITQAAPIAQDPGDLPYGISPEAQAQSQAIASPQAQGISAPVEAGQTQLQDPYGTEAFGQAYGQGLGEQKSGIFGEAEAAGRTAGMQQQALQGQIAQQQQIAKSYQDHYQNLDKERQDFLNDINDNHIDPQHYIQSMGASQKIATAIGLILGGIGGGLLHQENPAMKFLQSQIDRDIDSQRSNLGKQESLLNANMHQFGNLKDATDMTRIMQMDIVSNQLKQAAAKTTDMAAKSRALQAAGQLDAQSAPVLSQIAMRKSLLNGMAQGQILPESIVRMVIPEKQQEAAYKELQSAQGMNKSKDNILSAFDRIAQINTLGNRVTSPLQTSKQVSALRDPLLAQLVKDSEGRITPQDTKMIESLFPAVGDSAETVAMKRAQTAKFITEKMNFPLLKSYGIAPQGRFNDVGQSKIQESAPVIR